MTFRLYIYPRGIFQTVAKLPRTPRVFYGNFGTFFFLKHKHNSFNAEIFREVLALYVVIPLIVETNCATAATHNSTQSSLTFLVKIIYLYLV